jgi:hypothetical protein
MPVLTSLQFFSKLRWLDGRNLLDTIEPYRRRLFTSVLDSYRDDGVPRFSFCLIGRGKKNYKSTDLILIGLYKLLVGSDWWDNDVLLLANDEQQALDDLSLLKKLIEVNPIIADELDVLAKEVRRRDGKGIMKVLPARDIAGAHGKSAAAILFDEIWAYRNHDLFEALAPDPGRADVLVAVASYDTIWTSPGVPLVDFKALGMAGTDPRFYFQWFSGDYCSDPDFRDLDPEARANPSMQAWPEGRAYLEQQRRRLPAHKYRRLHLNIGGAVNGAFLDQAAVEAAIVRGRTCLPPEIGRTYYAWTDLSGGSHDDSTLAIAHEEDGKAVLDLLIAQDGSPPFNPRFAVVKFAMVLKHYGIRTIFGDSYAGQTFRADFAECGIDYQICRGRVGSKLREADTSEAPAVHRTDLYEALEPALNCGDVELLDLPKLKEQLLTLVVRGSAIDHEVGGFDDWANSAAGALYLVNPNRAGNYAEHWLRYYRNLPEREAEKEAAASASQPSDPPPLQFRYSITTRPVGHVLLRVPGEISSIVGMSGTTYTPVIVDGVRVAHLGAEDAKALIVGNSTFREANPDLVAQLSRVGPPRPGIRVGDILQTAADAAARNPRMSAPWSHAKAGF